MIDLLDQPAIRAGWHDGGERVLSLCETFAALAATDRIGSFRALRAHQRHAWHAFLCQVGALALLATGQRDVWTDPAAWRDALAGLAGDHADTAWSPVAPIDRPALLQPPIPDGMGALTKLLPTPDALDMLVTSRNHDLKAAVAVDAAPDDWLFALVTLQTMEGFLGAGNYGVSRMNGGFGSRPALGVAPDGGPGAQFRRDVGRLLALRGTLPSSAIYRASGGIGLLWLHAWDGAASLPPDRLDEYYVEICRRARLMPDASGRLVARAGGSKATRVAETPGGITGDPWAPVVADGNALKVFTVTAAGFHYRRMVDLIWPKGGAVPAPLQTPDPTDAPQGLTIVARALARGQGKTEGYHERRVMLSNTLRRGRRPEATDQAANVASERVRIAADARRVLHAALLALFQGGPETIDFRDKDGMRKAEPFERRLDARIDAAFFEALGRELEADDPAAERRAWVRCLLDQAEALLTHAEASAPRSTRRRLRAAVNAHAALRAMARSAKELGPHLTRETTHG